MYMYMKVKIMVMILFGLKVGDTMKKREANTCNLRLHDELASKTCNWWYHIRVHKH